MHYILYENVSAGVRVLDISAHVFILNFPTKACIYFKCYFNAKNPEQLLKQRKGVKYTEIMLIQKSRGIKENHAEGRR